MITVRPPWITGISADGSYPKGHQAIDKLRKQGQMMKERIQASALSLRPIRTLIGAGLPTIQWLIAYKRIPKHQDRV